MNSRKSPDRYLENTDLIPKSQKDRQQMSRKVHFRRFLFCLSGGLLLVASSCGSADSELTDLQSELDAVNESIIDVQTSIDEYQSKIETVKVMLGIVTTTLPPPTTRPPATQPQTIATNPPAVAPVPQPQPVQEQVFVVDQICEAHEYGLSSSWYGVDYSYQIYDVWSDGSRSYSSGGFAYIDRLPYYCTIR